MSPLNCYVTLNLIWHKPDHAGCITTAITRLIWGVNSISSQLSSDADTAMQCLNWHTHFPWLELQRIEKKYARTFARRFINSLCIQSPSVQFWDWRTSPSQSFPPFLGAGLLQSLLLHWVHSVPQADHLLQSVHTPSTTVKEAKRMIYTKEDKWWERKEMRQGWRPKLWLKPVKV